VPFDLGDLVPLTVTIKDASGAAANATTVALTITLPDGTTVTPTVTNPPATTGVYEYDYPTVQAGRHLARWTSTGPQAAYVDVFDVRSATPPYIGSLAALKAQLNMTGTTDDEELRTHLEAATGVVERYLKRAVVRRPFTEQHTVRGGPLVLNWTPVVSLTSVATTDAATTWDVSELTVTSAGIVTPVTGSIVGEVETVYVAGMEIIPAEYVLAALIVAQHLWETQRGQTGGPFAGGLDMPGAGITSFGFSIPNRAKELLGESPPLVA
jgi:hypothetical protein